MTNRPVWKQRLGGLFFGALLAQAAVAVPLVSTVATPSMATLGQTIALDVVVTGAVDLYAYQFSLAFNPAVLQVTSITEGPFLASAGSTFWDGGTVDNTAGSILTSFDALLGSIPGKTGNGVLERIVFTVKGGGTSPIVFSDLQFLDSGFNDLGAQSVSGSVIGVVPEPASATLLGLGLAAFGLVRGRRARRPTAALSPAG